MAVNSNAAGRATPIPSKSKPHVVAGPTDLKAVTAHFPACTRLPTSTYRLQFGPALTFRDAQRIVPYLWELGITDCYASPYLKARPESTHGYDVADYNALNPAFGTTEDYGQFVDTLRRFGMGQIMDVVPNHMGIGSANAAWMDVLENGPGSPYATFFDIDWNPLMAGEELHNRVLLPILGDQYGKVLEGQELRLAYEDGTFYVYYHDRKLPTAPHTQTALLSYNLPQLEAALGPDREEWQEYQSIITGLGHLPAPTETAPEKIAERQREKEVIKRRLANLQQRCAEVQATIDNMIAAYNGVPGDARSFDLLDALLGRQSYRLAYWRVAADEINYRRFFDINDLAAIRMENPDVFRETHQLILRLVEEGAVTGLRIDHPDGLWDPAGHFRQLQRSYFLRLCQNTLGNGRGNSSDQSTLPLSVLAEQFEQYTMRRSDHTVVGPLYIVVEKILSKGERLPEDWLVHGTTGYDFANAVNGIFVQRSNRRLFDKIYADFTGNRVPFPNLANSCKKMIMLISLASEVIMLGYQLKRISAKHRWYRDFTLSSLTFAIREVIACLPVYRTYVVAHRPGADRQCSAYIEAAIAEAKKRNPRTAPSLFDFIGEILLQRQLGHLEEDDRLERGRFLMKFQQTTGPVMAKGIEDTAFYIYNRLTSLNEVGGSPEQFGTTVPAFHRQNIERQRHWPHGMICTSTHDTKRSEDVRARINVLSELPREWKAALARWSELNSMKRSIVDGQIAPDANEEYLFYQTLLGAWPMERMDRAAHDQFVQRIGAYMLKAIKEAKVNTSWINPNEEYDVAVRQFVQEVLDDRQENAFLTDFAHLQQKVAHFGVYNALSQTLLKIASPGAPDFYQGNEIWDFSLVDPDSRRPVDFEHRERLLRELRRQMSRAGDHLANLVGQLLDTKEDGRIKLFITHRGLTYRRDHDDLFRFGTYLPLAASGSKREHVCAFARRRGKHSVVVVVPRLLAGLAGGALAKPLGPEVWLDSSLAMPQPSAVKRYRNVFTGERLEAITRGGRPVLLLQNIFASFPVALLEGLGQGEE